MLFAIVFSIALMGFGFISIFGGMMSDAPIEGANDAKVGAIIFLIGIVILIGSIVAHFQHVAGF